MTCPIHQVLMRCVAQASVYEYRTWQFYWEKTIVEYQGGIKQDKTAVHVQLEPENPQNTLSF